MGKLNVTMLRYLTKEDFRVLTAVSIKLFNKDYFFKYANAMHRLDESIKKINIYQKLKHFKSYM